MREIARASIDSSSSTRTRRRRAASITRPDHTISAGYRTSRLTCPRATGLEELSGLASGTDGAPGSTPKRCPATGLALKEIHVARSCDSFVARPPLVRLLDERRTGR